MKRTLVIADETHELEIHRRGGTTVMVWDGEEFPFDIVRVEPTSYSVIMDGHSVGANIDRIRNVDPDLHGFRASVYDGAYEFTLQDPHKPKPLTMYGFNVTLNGIFLSLVIWATACIISTEPMA